VAHGAHVRPSEPVFAHRRERAGAPAGRRDHETVGRDLDPGRGDRVAHQGAARAANRKRQTDQHHRQPAGAERGRDQRQQDQRQDA
jgi:hypothetical protein